MRQYKICRFKVIYKKGGKKMTNYDRIKSMSVEEMAKATTILFYKVKDYTNAEHYIKQWLEQEVEENDR